MTPEELEELRLEVEFYQIPSLIELLLPVVKVSTFKEGCTGFVLSEENRVSTCLQSTGNFNICVGNQPIVGQGEWTFIIQKGQGHNDRIGFVLQSELTHLANQSLDTCALYVYNNPGAFFKVTSPVQVVNPLTVQIKQSDKVKFVVNSGATRVSVFINDQSQSAAEFSLPPGNSIYPAFGSKNNGSIVCFV